VTNEESKSPSPFNVQTVRHLVALMGRYDLSEIDLQEGDQRIRLRRGARNTVTASPALPPAVAPASPNTPAPRAEPATPSKPVVTIKSPTPGTFYASPSPDVAPFVKVGSRVTANSIVCIIEAMKIFNEIPAECSGVITEVLVDNQQPVEYDQVLFKVDPTG
jgi:acetyl-CoA carboxylase biotin carboxyl carrier protein